MNKSDRLAELHELFLRTQDSWTPRLLAVVLSLLLAGVVLWLVRRRSLREEYTPIWLLVAFGITVISVWYELLTALTRAIGAWTPSSTLFFLGHIFLVTICLNYAVRLSRLTLQIKNLSQDLALLRAQVEGSSEKARR